MAKSRIGLIRRIVSPWVIAATVFGLILQLGNTPTLALILRADPSRVALGCACSMAGIFLHAVLWQRTLVRMGTPIPLRAALRVWFLSQATRYAPGGIWSYLARPHLAARHGIPTVVTAASLAVEVAQTLGSAILVALATLPRYGVAAVGLAVGILIPLSARLLRTGSTRSVADRLPAWARVPTALTGAIQLDLLLLLPAYCAIWPIHGLGLFFLAGATYTVSLDELSELSGAAAMAWAVGFLCVLVPSGIGVREGTLGSLLASHAPPSALVALAILWRLSMTMGEIVCLIMVLLLTRRTHHRLASTSNVSSSTIFRAAADPEPPPAGPRP